MLAAFFFNDAAPTEIYTLSLHDALPISLSTAVISDFGTSGSEIALLVSAPVGHAATHSPHDTHVDWPIGLSRSNPIRVVYRSEEHTSELQSQSNLVCRLLLEKKKQNTKH